MSFILIIVAGLIPSVIMKVLRRTERFGRLFILGVTGSFIAGGMEYSQRQPISFVVTLVGAAIMVVLYAVITRKPVAAEEEERDDFRKAA